MMHWAEAYIGQPWQRGAAGPDAWDCWGLLRHVQKTHYGIVMPEIALDLHSLRAVIKTIGGHAERSNWIAVSQPEDGAVVLLSQGRDASHVGVHLAIDGGGVLHCQQHCGVVFSRTSVLAAMGWHKIEYYQRRRDAAE